MSSIGPLGADRAHLFSFLWGMGEETEDEKQEKRRKCV